MQQNIGCDRVNDVAKDHLFDPITIDSGTQCKMLKFLAGCCAYPANNLYYIQS